MGFLSEQQEVTRGMRGTEGDDEIPSIAAPPAGCEEEEGLLGGGNTKQEEESGVRAW